MGEWQTVVSGFLGLVGVVMASWLALRGTSKTNDTAGLDKAAGWWEKAVARLEEDVEELKKDRDTQAVQINKQAIQIQELEGQNETFRSAMSYVIVGLTERMEWESNGSIPPPPKFTLSMMLARLSTVLSEGGTDKDAS